MSRAEDGGPLPYNFRDVAAGLHVTTAGLHVCLPAGLLLRCGAVENFSWEAMGRPRTILNLRMGDDTTDVPADVTKLHIAASNSLEKYDTSDKAVREWLCSVLQALTTAELPVLIHCRSGRDRTGVVVAALLAVLGIPEDQIVGEFAQSDGATPALLEQTLRPWRSAGGIEQWARGVDLNLLRVRLLRAGIRDGTACTQQEKCYLEQRVQDLWSMAKPLGATSRAAQARVCCEMVSACERLDCLSPAARVFVAHGWCLETLASCHAEDGEGIGERAIDRVLALLRQTHRGLDLGRPEREQPWPAALHTELRHRAVEAYDHFLSEVGSLTLRMRGASDAETDEKAQRFVAQRLCALKRELLGDDGNANGAAPHVAKCFARFESWLASRERGAA